MKRLVHALDTALGLRRVRADDVDVELAQSSPELGLAVRAPRCALMGQAKDAVFVAVNEVVERRLGLHEPQLHHAARRIVDVHQERALRSAALKPSMRAPVDLNQLTKTRPTLPRLMDLRLSLLARLPERGTRHPLAQRLLRHLDAVIFSQLLSGQCRTEVAVSLPDERQRAELKLVRQAAIARHPTLSRCQAGRPLPLVRGAQPPNLPRPQSHQRRRLLLG